MWTTTRWSLTGVHVCACIHVNRNRSCLMLTCKSATDNTKHTTARKASGETTCSRYVQKTSVPHGPGNLQHLRWMLAAEIPNKHRFRPGGVFLCRSHCKSALRVLLFTQDARCGGNDLLYGLPVKSASQGGKHKTGVPGRYQQHHVYICLSTYMHWHYLSIYLSIYYLTIHIYIYMHTLPVYIHICNIYIYIYMGR